jgi:hypothetical protein
MKFTKEAGGLFTGRMGNPVSNMRDNKSGSGMLGLPRSVVAAAIVNPDEIRRMMDEFEVWHTAVSRGEPYGQQNPVQIAGLWLPKRELRRYPDDTLNKDIEAQTPKVVAAYQLLRQMRTNLGLTDRIITSEGRPALTPERLRWLINQFQQRYSELQQVSGPSDLRNEVWAAMDDCENSIRALQAIANPIDELDTLARRYEHQVLNGKEYIRIGADVWLNNPDLKWIFEQRAIGQDRRARNLDSYLKMLAARVTDNPDDWGEDVGQPEQRPDDDGGFGGGIGAAPGPTVGPSGSGPNTGGTDPLDQERRDRVLGQPRERIKIEDRFRG